MTTTKRLLVTAGVSIPRQYQKYFWEKLFPNFAGDGAHPKNKTSGNGDKRATREPDLYSAAGTKMQ
jgi:hypothetical protein